ncbi:MAG: hypothetical protein WCD70_09320 [Alphaproteobacteria bacterium]
MTQKNVLSRAKQSLMGQLRDCMYELAGGVLSKTGLRLQLAIVPASLGVAALSSLAGSADLRASIATGAIAAIPASLVVLGLAADFHNPEKPAKTSRPALQRFGVALPLIVALGAGAVVQCKTEDFIKTTLETTQHQAVAAPVAKYSVSIPHFIIK